MMKRARIIAILLAVLTVFGGCNSETAEPIDTSWTVSTDNYSLTRGQFTFFYNLVFEGNSAYSEHFGFSTDVPLNQQQCSMGDTAGYTWHDYFVDATEDKIEDLLVLGEAAKAAGVTLSDSDKASVELNISNLHSAAEKTGVSVESLIEENYGAGVTEEDVRFCLSLQLLAVKMKEHVRESADITDDQLAEECKKNPDSYYFCDYRYYTFTAETETNASQEEIDAAKAKAKSYADKLAAAKSEQEYIDIIEDYCRNEKKLSDKDIEITLSSTLKEGYGYSATSALAQWIFEKDGENYVHTTPQTKTMYNDNGGSYGVCYLVKPPYLKDYTVKDARHILFSADDEESMAEAKSKAENLLAELTADGITEEEFASAAVEYSMDGSAGQGGLMSDVEEQSLQAGLAEWLFDEERKPGDVGLVQTENGYHLVFCVSQTVKWKAYVENSLREAAYQTAYAEFCDKYTVNVNEPCLGTIESA